MASFKVLFQDLVDNYETRVDARYHDEVGSYVNINIVSIDDSNIEVNLLFDISTAIKLSKTLRTEINKAKEWESCR